MEKTISKASFVEIYKYLKGKNKDALWEFFENTVKSGLILFPTLMSSDLKTIVGTVTLSTLFNGIITIRKNKKSLVSILKDYKHSDYSSRYNQMQTVQVLLVYSSFIDSIGLLIPNEENKLLINGKTYEISKEDIEKYFNKYILENNNKSFEDIDILKEEIESPNPTIGLKEYEDRLKDFYKKLSEGIYNFYTQCGLLERNEEINNDYLLACINDLPNKAFLAYKQQYYELARNIPDFNVWLTIQHDEVITNKIDVGFDTAFQKFNDLKTDIEIIKDELLNKGIKALRLCEEKYQKLVSLPPIEIDQLSDDISFVGEIKKEDIFIPQHYKSIIYNDNMVLEHEKMWDELKIQDIPISEFIHSSLYHSCTNDKPLIILGMPGAGKSLLSLMLSSKILCNDFYPIIVKLRDIDPNKEIDQQICNQIYNDSKCQIEWSDINNNTLDKPLLVIFDGFDELLQASNTPHNDYIKRIIDFLKLECSHINVKTIITSRTALIDNVRKPNGSMVIKLVDFDEKQINKWCEIWNKKTGKVLKINNECGYFEFAKQPLLLLMLALYATKHDLNELNENVKKTELYDKIIKDFIERELLKKSTFSKLNDNDKSKSINRELIKLSIIALGMYNRNKLYISTDIVRNDMKFLINADPDDLLEGKFFFVLNQKAITHKNGDEIKTTAIEFLHNTFGEYLTVCYFKYAIEIFINKNKTNVSLFETSNQEITFNDELLASFCYSPMFYRPNIIRMLDEEINSSELIDKDEILSLFETIINNSLSTNLYSVIYDFVTKQNNFFDIKDVRKHLANFLTNILIVTLLANKGISCEENIWNQLIYIFKAAYNNEELVKMSSAFFTTYSEQCFTVKMNERYKKIDTYDIKISQKLKEELFVSKCIGDIKLYELAACLHKPYIFVTDSIIKKNNFDIESIHKWNKFNMSLGKNHNFEFSDTDIKELLEIPELSLKEGNLDIFILSSNYIIDLIILNRIDYSNLSIIIRLFEKLKLFINNSLLYNNKERKLVYFDSINGLIDKIIKIFSNIYKIVDIKASMPIINDLMIFIRASIPYFPDPSKNELILNFYRAISFMPINIVYIKSVFMDIYEYFLSVNSYFSIEIIKILRNCTNDSTIMIISDLINIFRKNAKLFDKDLLLEIICYLIENNDYIDEDHINKFIEIIYIYIDRFDKDDLLYGIYRDSIENFISYLDILNKYITRPIIYDFSEIIKELKNRKVSQMYIDYLENYYKYVD